RRRGFTSVELGRRGVGVFGQFGVHQFAQRVGKLRRAAVFAIFGRQHARNAAHVVHAVFLEQRGDFVDRVGHVLVGRLVFFAAVQRPYAAVVDIVAVARGE